MNNPQEDCISELREKTKRIIELYTRAKEQLEFLQEENKELKTKLHITEKEIIEINNKYDTLKIAKSMMVSGDDKHDAKIRVNKMVREIDKCIALLNR
jgi:phage shock protein A